MISTSEAVVIMTRAELDELIRRAAAQAANAVAEKINHGSGNHDELWDARKVGEYLGLSAYTIANSTSLERGFPKAITLGTGPKARRRWKADEVIGWAHRRAA